MVGNFTSQDFRILLRSLGRDDPSREIGRTAPKSRPRRLEVRRSSSEEAILYGYDNNDVIIIIIIIIDINNDNDNDNHDNNRDYRIRLVVMRSDHNTNSNKGSRSAQERPSNGAPRVFLGVGAGRHHSPPLTRKGG